MSLSSITEGSSQSGEHLRAAGVGGAHGQAVDRRQVFLGKLDRAPIGRIGNGEAFGLRLVEGGERAAAGVA